MTDLPPASAVPGPGLQTADDRRADLQPKPVRPEWIVAGAPVARALVLSDDGDGLVTGLWDCTAGTFEWHYASDEVIHVVDGEATLELENGQLLNLSAGDIAHFSPGTKVTWYVDRYVKKFYVDRILPGDPLSRTVRGLRALAKRLLRRG